MDVKLFIFSRIAVVLSVITLIGFGYIAFSDLPLNDAELKRRFATFEVGDVVRSNMTNRVGYVINIECTPMQNQSGTCSYDVRFKSSKDPGGMTMVYDVRDFEVSKAYK